MTLLELVRVVALSQAPKYKFLIWYGCVNLTPTSESLIQTVLSKRCLPPAIAGKYYVCSVYSSTVLAKNLPPLLLCE